MSTLSFFSVNDSSSDDGSSSDSEENNQEIKDNAVVHKTEGGLPPPLQVLESAKTPEFVTSHIRSDMDWDKMVKAAPYVPPKEFKPWENALPSVDTQSTTKSKKPDISLIKGAPQTLVPVPPKREATKEKGKNIIDHAVTWSKMYKDSDFSSLAAKRPRPEDEDKDLAGFCHTDINIGKVAYQTKHQKTNNPVTFREKEKRKRDAGQANRDKSFVEEEKRILKQKFDD